MTTLDASRSGTDLLLAPFAIVGRATLGSLGYLGSVALLLGEAFLRMLWPFRRAGSLEGALPRLVIHELGWMIGLGVPIVALIHVAMGSFLALQAYYGSTFVDGTGAVVGVGLVRNLGGIMTGLSFSGILATRMIPELRMRSDQLKRQGLQDAMGELAAPRIVAGGIACVLLSLWGVAVGTLVGWQSSQAMMGISTESFFLMMNRMLWFRDVVGLVVKGVAFGIITSAIACHEGLSWTEPAGNRASAVGFPAPALTTPILRAACLSMAAVLVMNSSWFILMYHAVPFYGPTLLPPPGP